MNRLKIPEPRRSQPEDVSVTAGGCGHEVYEGERLIEWHNGRRFSFICEECFRDQLAALTIEELARQFGCICVTVLP